MSLKKKLLKILTCLILTSLCVIVILWIFSYSAENGAVSSDRSENVTHQIQDTVGSIAPSSPIATATGEDFDRLHAFVRKSAHFLEYALLGALFALTLRAYTRLKRFWFVPVWLLFLTAATDEYIQTYSSGRVSSLGDVLLDFSGGTAGLLFGALCLAAGFLIVGRIRHRRALRAPRRSVEE